MKAYLGADVGNPNRALGVKTFYRGTLTVEGKEHWRCAHAHLKRPDALECAAQQRFIQGLERAEPAPDWREPLKGQR